MICSSIIINRLIELIFGRHHQHWSRVKFLNKLCQKHYPHNQSSITAQLMGGIVGGIKEIWSSQRRKQMMIFYSLLLIFMSFNTLKCQSNVGDIRASPSPSKKIILHNETPFSNGQLLKILCHINKPGIQDHGTGQYFRNRFVNNKYGISFFLP